MPTLAMKHKMKSNIKPNSLLLLVCLSATASNASPETFDFKDPKGVNNVVFQLDAPLESVNGSANGITGTVSFDPANPGTTTGVINVAADSLTVPNPLQKEHLHGPNWLDVAKYPDIKFEAQSLSEVRTVGNTTTAEVTGIFSLHGVSQTVTAPLTLTYLPGRLGDRVPGQHGDLLVIRSQFSIKRGDFNIQKGQYEDKVSEDIHLTLAIAGACAKP